MGTLNGEEKIIDKTILLKWNTENRNSWTGRGVGIYNKSRGEEEGRIPKKGYGSLLFT